MAPQHERAQQRHRVDAVKKGSDRIARAAHEHANPSRKAFAPASGGPCDPRCSLVIVLYVPIASEPDRANTTNTNAATTKVTTTISASTVMYLHGRVMGCELSRLLTSG